jgi:hypothetical protein
MLPDVLMLLNCHLLLQLLKEQEEEERKCSEQKASISWSSSIPAFASLKFKRSSSSSSSSSSTEDSKLEVLDEFPHVQYLRLERTGPAAVTCYDLRAPNAPCELLTTIKHKLSRVSG